MRFTFLLLVEPHGYGELAVDAGGFVAGRFAAVSMTRKARHTLGDRGAPPGAFSDLRKNDARF
jgi:hypothetical protein